MDDVKDLVPATDRDALIDDLRDIIVQGRGRAAAAVNAEVVRTYWRIGERIVREEHGATRSAYGEGGLARLGVILSREFGRGFAERSLQNMRQFYLAYPNASTLRTELGWSHYRALMRLPDEQRIFYGQVAAAGRWSSRELDKQVNSMLYERTALSRAPNTLLEAIPRGETAATSHVGAFKDPYVLDFLGLDDTFSEKELEAALVHQMEKFLIELGTGFYFGGRQKRIDIGGEDFYIDLVFWHRTLKCQVLIDLKIGALSHADISQMQLYLNWVQKYDLAEGENDPIGLILCGSRNEQVVELLLPTDGNRAGDERIKVAQYLLLDSEDAIKQQLAKIRTAYDEAHGGAEASDE